MANVQLPKSILMKAMHLKGYITVLHRASTDSVHESAHASVVVSCLVDLKDQFQQTWSARVEHEDLWGGH